jgi:DNA helicase-2/ATP-dependent DNA helicase PcrA
MQHMFDVRKLDITDEEIAFVEGIFGFEFNEGQKKIIRFWDNTDIQACPGSGKTTTLAAKLIILANKIPKSFQQGICVITHTNVAVEEIKEKLGSYSPFYQNYPNHLGTIQSVVDKFFTIPAFKNEHKFSPSIVDTDSYCKEMNKFNLLNGTATFLSVKGLDEVGYLSYNKSNFEISKSINHSERYSVNGINAVKMDVHYQKIKKVKDLLLKDGYIKYDEAYSIAFKYLRDNASVCGLFSKRFPLVFIDEMQDMETHQTELISMLCDGTPAIVQKIGDKNQSIYNYSSSEDNIEWEPKLNLELQLTETTRISDNIVQAVKNICVSPQEMTGWTNTSPLKPTIILFDDDSISMVKDRFAELVIGNNLHKGRPCKVIGARLSESRLNINSYWADFNRGYNKKDFSNIASFLANASHLALKSSNVKEVRKTLLSVLCKGLRICKVKSPATNFYFTPFTLCQFLNSFDDQSHSKKLNEDLLNWISALYKTESFQAEMEQSILDLVSFIGGTLNEELKEFFTKPEIESLTEKTENKIYQFSSNGKELNLHFDTIHGVKGETHTATLYLETYNRLFDIGGKVLEFIIAEEKQQVKYRKIAAFKSRLPLAYVAMSRATHFVCLAVHKDRFTEQQKEYFKSSDDWDVTTADFKAI